MFTAAWFTIAKIWKQLKCLLTDRWMNVLVQWNVTHPRDYHTKWSKSDTERWISYDIIYMWNLKK